MKQPILLTGIHRSGSTWTGRMISEAKGIYYIDEAFTPSKKHFNNPIDRWYLDVDHLDSQQQKKVKTYLLNHAYSCNYHIFNYMLNPQKYSIKQYLYKLSGNIKNIPSFAKQPLFKDPIALFSAEWFYKRLDAKVIILIRHPAAFVSSAFSKGWSFPLDEFQSQTELIDTHLNEYKEQIRSEENQKDLLLQNILAWNLIYKRVLQYQANYPQWLYVKHENLITNPIKVFEKIFDYLEIEFTDSLKNRILNKSQISYSGSSNTNKSKSNSKSWKTKLNQETINLIRNKTFSVWSELYSKEDW